MDISKSFNLLSKGQIIPYLKIYFYDNIYFSYFSCLTLVKIIEKPLVKFLCVFWDEIYIRSDIFRLADRFPFIFFRLLTNNFVYNSLFLRRQLFNMASNLLHFKKKFNFLCKRTLRFISLNVLKITKFKILGIRSR